GILGNNGILFSDSSEKAAQFIQLCNKIDVPLLFLQNITGYMVGTQYERGGIIKDGAKMINAVSNSTVPMFTVMIGSSYGAGNYGMCGRAYEPRFLFTWPNHRIAVMGPEQLAGVLSIVRRGAAERAGEPYDEAEDQAVRRADLPRDGDRHRRRVCGPRPRGPLRPRRRRGGRHRPAGLERVLPGDRADARRGAAHRGGRDPPGLRLPRGERGLRGGLRAGGRRLHRPTARRHP